MYRDMLIYYISDGLEVIRLEDGDIVEVLVATVSSQGKQLTIE